MTAISGRIPEGKRCAIQSVSFWTIFWTSLAVTYPITKKVLSNKCVILGYERLHSSRDLSSFSLLFV